MKILITGANGMLAFALKKALRPNNKLVLADIDNMDITKSIEVGAFFAKAKPDLVIHTAAFTDVDGAEKNKIFAFKINRDGTRNIAQSCHKMSIPIVYFSTDYIFGGGKKSPYRENDKVNPLSIYGMSKYAGEEQIRRINKSHYIIRTAWLFGEHGKNFIDTIIRLTRDNPTLKIVSDQKGTPTYTHDLAEAVKKLINTNKYGTYHITNSGACTWYQLAKAIIKLKRLNNTVLPISSIELARPAKRPRYSVLSKRKISKLKIKLRPWREALKHYLKNY